MLPSSAQQQQQDEATLTLEASDIIRLVLGFLTAQGLHESARVLRQESGIGLPLTARLGGNTMITQIQQGEWGSLMRALQLYQSPPPFILQQVILELALSTNESSSSSAGAGLAMAQQLLAVSRQDLDQIPVKDEDDDERHEWSVARSLEQRLAAIAANPTKYATAASRQVVLFPKKTGISLPTRRQQLAADFEAATVPLPLNRLTTLLHQSLKWQAWTGQLPMITMDDDDDTTADDKANGTKQCRRRKRKRYNLLLGTASEDHGAVVGDPSAAGDDDYAEPIPQERVAKIKFGKAAVCEAATTLRNGIVTASSDGFIEIWQLGGSFDLNTIDFPYQAQDQVMGHEDPVLALSVSKDQTLLASGDASGFVKIFSIANGKCLRQFQAHQSSSITSLDWSMDGSKILVASSQGLCREFGIVSQHALQEYTGHVSSIHSCSYLMGSNRRILTSSADGTVRLWKHGQCEMIWQPQNNPSDGASLVVDPTGLLTESPVIVSACVVPSHPSQVLVVPRSTTAYLVNVDDGTILERYSMKPSQEDVVYCAATVTADWVYLCTTGNECLVFRLHNGGRLEQSIRDFAKDSTSPASSSATVPEISQLIPHPHKPILAAFSNDKTQKKGVLAVWK